ncbi:cellulose binding domain-containing protein [Kitasatospora phosalacinea]|uniref:cellulose binding domain-containing protein n=1 Tax=Kitasatospora phosalacinea TaxID=2065 RepID=UPI00366240BB
MAYAKNQWQGGLTANVTLTFSFPGDTRIGNAWNATVTRYGTEVTATNLPYNGSVAPGGTASFGFQGNWTTDDRNPTAFPLNGTGRRLGRTGRPKPKALPPNGRKGLRPGKHCPPSPWSAAVPLDGLRAPSPLLAPYGPHPYCQRWSADPPATHCPANFTSPPPATSALLLPGRTAPRRSRRLGQGPCAPCPSDRPVAYRGRSTHRPCHTRDTRGDLHVHVRVRKRETPGRPETNPTPSRNRRSVRFPRPHGRAVRKADRAVPAPNPPSAPSDPSADRHSAGGVN